MLGLTKPDSSWNWAAYGKHPAAKDYFRVGQDFPVMRSFSNWVEEGYSNLLPNGKNNLNPISWRFWAKGAVKEMLICGLLKDSSDNIGRQYPLLIMGSGLLKNWEEHWDDMPYSCEKTWNQIEYISSQGYSDLKKLESEINGVRPPLSGWSELNAKWEDAISNNPENFQNNAVPMSGEGDSFIPLDHKDSHDQGALISRWHHLLMSHDKTVPNVTFMGGTFEKVYLAFFRRPLAPADFIRLWSVSSAEKG
ncbi:MAG: DUF2094 domain-containing protein [Nitrospirae bacterium]|nr:DUF2094 domain-containing protein [Nitrospirota bacterium]